jgi:hypothetical protein
LNNPVTTSTDTTWASQANMRYWDEVKGDVIGRLRLADAYLARINIGEWSQRNERREWLKMRVGELIRAAKAEDVLGDPSLVGMVRDLYGERGVIRLRDRVANSANSANR